MTKWNKPLAMLALALAAFTGVFASGCSTHSVTNTENRQSDINAQISCAITNKCGPGTHCEPTLNGGTCVLDAQPDLFVAQAPDMTVPPPPCGGACTGGMVCNTTTNSCECPMGRSDCGGVCKDLAGDALNCGACNVVCSTNNITRTCSGGVCDGACTPGFADCNNNRQADGCESELATDPNNCGTCGTTCANGCANGVCNPPPADMVTLPDLGTTPLDLTVAPSLDMTTPVDGTVLLPCLGQCGAGTHCDILADVCLPGITPTRFAVEAVKAYPPAAGDWLGWTEQPKTVTVDGLNLTPIPTYTPNVGFEFNLPAPAAWQTVWVVVWCYGTGTKAVAGSVVYWQTSGVGGSTVNTGTPGRVTKSVNGLGDVCFTNAADTVQ